MPAKGATRFSINHKKAEALRLRLYSTASVTGC